MGIEEGMYTFRSKVTDPDGVIEVSYSEDNYCKDREQMSRIRNEYKKELEGWHVAGTIVHVSDGVRQACPIPGRYREIAEEEEDNNLIEYDDLN